MILQNKEINELNKQLKTVRCFWERNKWIIQSVGQPLENFANWDPINALILLFRRLKKTNLKARYSEN